LSLFLKHNAAQAVSVVQENNMNDKNLNKTEELENEVKRLKQDLAEILENLVMAHRYMYYVKSTNVISDYEYDILEHKAKEICSSESPVHQVGSSLPESYSRDNVRLAHLIYYHRYKTLIP